MGRKKREETDREGVWEIKVSLSWPNTVKLSGDQPLKWRTVEERRLPKTEQTGREVFYYPE